MAMLDDRHEAMVEVSRRIGGSTQRGRAMDDVIIDDLPCELADELELLFGWGHNASGSGATPLPSS